MCSIYRVDFCDTRDGNGLTQIGLVGVSKRVLWRAVVCVDATVVPDRSKPRCTYKMEMAVGMESPNARLPSLCGWLQFCCCMHAAFLMSDFARNTFTVIFA